MKLDLVQIPFIISLLYLILLLRHPSLAMSALRKSMAIEDHSVIDHSPNPQPIPPSATPNPPPKSDQSSTKSLSALMDIFKGSIHNNVLKLSQPSNSAPPPNPPMAPNPDLKKICASTDYPQICLSTISPFFSNYGNLDTVEVLRMAIEACVKQINDTKDLAKEQLANKGVDGDAVKICKDEYDDALDNLKNAMDAVKTRDIGTLQSMLSAVISDVSTCTDELNGKKSPIEARDNLISNMASNCLAIASLVK